MVGLRRNDYAGPALHETATAKSIQYPPVLEVPQVAIRRQENAVVRPAPVEMKRQESVDTDAEPLSSEEEDEEMPDPTPKTKRYQASFDQLDNGIMRNQQRMKVTREGTTAEKRKDAGTRRSGRRKIADDPMEITLVHDEEQKKDAGKMSDDEAMYQAWQDEPANKKRKTQFKKYHGSGTVNIHTSAANKQREDGFQSVPNFVSPSRSSNRLRSSFQAPQQFESPTLASHKRAGFIVPTENNLPERRNTRAKLKDEEQIFKLPDDMLSPRSATANAAIFKLPLDSTSSSATTADQPLTVFSHPDSPPLVRSKSASSLSSVDSIASLLLTQDEKDSLMKNDADTDTNLQTAQCPLCSAPVSNILLEEFTIRFSQNKTRLPSRLQQKFCREHRAQTARDTWDELGYPTIDWTALATTRVTRHLPAMRAILHNRTPSFYRDKLVEAKKAGKGRKNLLKYHKEGVLDVAKYGYYGPRGGKVAAETLMLRLSRDLADVAERDGLVREVSAVGFVQAVLVPELVGRWVAEDRGLRSEGEGWKEEVRAVLEESSEVGGLVNEDEDRVVVVTDKDREKKKGRDGRDDGHVDGRDDGHVDGRDDGHIDGRDD